MYICDYWREITGTGRLTNVVSCVTINRMSNCDTNFRNATST